MSTTTSTRPTSTASSTTAAGTAITMPTTTSYVAEADSNTNWDERVKLYAQAEQVLIDQAMIVPLVHPITMAVISDTARRRRLDAQLAGLHPARSARPLLLHAPQQEVGFREPRSPASSRGALSGGKSRA